MSYENQKKINLKLNLAQEESNKDLAKRKTFSSSKKYTQDEFSFKSDNNLIQVEVKRAGTTPECHRDQYNLDKLQRKSDPGELLELALSKTDKKLKNSSFKKLKSVNVDDSIEIDNLKIGQSVDDFSSFTFLNCFNGKNHPDAGSMSHITDLSDYPSFQKQDQPRKKSYIEDIPITNIATKYSPTLMPKRTVEVIEKVDSPVNDQKQEKFIEGSMQNIQNYYDYTFECMKKIQNVQRLPIEQVKYTRLENLPFEKDIYFQSKKE
jgi:hypothetical protein